MKSKLLSLVMWRAKLYPSRSGLIFSNKEIHKIFPNQQVKVTIHPLRKGDDYRKYNFTNKSFTERNFSQKGEQWQTPEFLANLSPFHRGLMEMFGQLYWLRDYKVNWLSSSQKGLSVVDSNSKQGGEDGNNSNQSFLNNIADFQKRKGSPANSQPIDKNEYNQSFF